MRRLAALAVALLAAPAAAQDAQFWTQQYGTRSELLSGAVVGSPQDLSTTFYNPGGLAQLETETFLLSANAIEYQRLGLHEPSGQFREIASDRVGTAPSFLTGLLPRSWTPGTLAYSFLTRQKFELRVNPWGVDPPAEPERAAINLHVDRHLQEDWGGLTWAGMAGDFGVGISLYGAYRSQRARSELISQPLPEDASGIDLMFIDDYSYWHFRMLAKIGAYWRGEPASLGLTVTTPGLGLFGSGDAAYYRSLVVTDSSGTVPAIRDAQVESGLGADYKSPASVAGGLRLESGRGALYVTAEWFAPVDRFDVLPTTAFPDTGLASTLVARLTEEYDSIVNVAIGGEYSPWETVTLYASALRDAAAVPSDSRIAHSVSTWDILQFTGGAAFTYAGVDFTVGASFGFGSDALGPAFPDASPTLQAAELRYRRMKAFLGFEFTS